MKKKVGDKKAQIAIVGTVLTVLLFVIVLVLLYSQFRIFLKDRRGYAEVSQESTNALNLLLEEGVPRDWPQSPKPLVKLGILDKQELDLEKLKAFGNISYEETKLHLGATFDYLFYIEQRVDQGPWKQIFITGEDGYIREFFGWNGFIQTYTGNGGEFYDYFFDFIDDNANHLARSEAVLAIKGAPSSKSVARVVMYTWDSDLILIKTRCNNGDDDDFDGFIDFPADIGCFDFLDNDEVDPPFDLECEFVTEDSCSRNTVEVLQMGLGLFRQRHVAVPRTDRNLDVFYPHRICCGYSRYMNVSIDLCPSDDAYVRLDQYSNAHLQISGNFSHPVCIPATYLVSYNMSCNFEPIGNNCGINKTCVVAVDETRSHGMPCVGDEDTQNKVCCGFRHYSPP